MCSTNTGPNQIYRRKTISQLDLCGSHCAFHNKILCKQTITPLPHHTHSISPSPYLTCRTTADNMRRRMCKSWRHFDISFSQPSSANLKHKGTKVGWEESEAVEEHMVDGDPVSFPCLLCIPSSPGTPGINTPCGIDTQPEFYFLLISSPLSLSLPDPYVLDSLYPVSFFCLFFFHSAPLFSLFHSVLFLSAHPESAL